MKIVKESKGYAKGEHIKNGYSEGITARKIRVSYDQPILLQCDGEVALLTRAHFPLIIEKTAPCVRVLSKVDEN
jgi:diacylglycerol kinase family enzyme